MKHLSLSLSLFVSGLLGSLMLSGCSGFNNLEVSGPVQQQVTMGGLNGSNFGGHAPVTQADVYLFQVGTGGYASTPTSLLTSIYNTQFGYATTDNSAADGAPSGALSVKTDNTGSFYISNYTCTVGYPVYLAAVGGTTTSYSPFAIQSYTIAGVTGKGFLGGAPYTGGTITFNIAAGEKAILYVGQTVSLTTAINGVSSPVTVTASTVPTATAAGSFTITNPISSNTNNNGTTAYSGNGVPNGSPNQSTINLATLGLCPSAGNFYTAGAGKIDYVYMNEVSTMATALAFGGFGTGPFNIGIPSVASGDTADGAALALTGIKNAALNAAQLYDITGTAQSQVNEGEGHIARTYTPAGNGIVPQRLLDTLGNILADCVDSVNTGGSPTAAFSTQCMTLFENATSSGTTASAMTTAGVPLDIATAAFNLAHHPGGPAGVSNTAFMNALFPLQTPNAPFSPNLTTQPNDFTAAIEYTANVNGQTNPVTNAESIGIDLDGSVWINSAGTKQIIKFNPQGVVQYTSPSNATSYGYLSIDPAGNVWSGGGFNSVKETEFIGSGTSYTPTLYNGPATAPFTGTNLYDPYITVTDASGNAYTSATPPSNTNQWYTVEFGPGGATPTAITLAPSIPANYNVGHGAIDSAGYVWWTTEVGTGNGITGTAVGRFNLTDGSTAAGFPIHTNANNYTGTVGQTNANISAPEMPSLDSTGNLWVANQNAGNNGSIMRITPAGVVTSLLYNATGAPLIDGPFGVSVDGAGHAWVANRSTGTSTNASLLELQYAGGKITAISPIKNFSLGFGIPGNTGNAGSKLPLPLNLAVDPSGVVWITSYDGSAVFELLGPGAPTYNPISTAIGKSRLGSTP